MGGMRHDPWWEVEDEGLGMEVKMRMNWCMLINFKML